MAAAVVAALELDEPVHVELESLEAEEFELEPLELYLLAILVAGTLRSIVSMLKHNAVRKTGFIFFIHVLLEFCHKSQQRLCLSFEVREFKQLAICQAR